MRPQRATVCPSGSTRITWARSRSTINVVPSLSQPTAHGVCRPGMWSSALPRTFHSAGRSPPNCPMWPHVSVTLRTARPSTMIVATRMDKARFM